jgi:integrase/recombinase XerD
MSFDWVHNTFETTVSNFAKLNNEHRNPIQVDIPLHQDLAAIIAATPSGHMTFLTTEYGKPFSPNGFGNKFRKWCDQAGLPPCSAHGLRKATATRLAEGGASAHEIMAITGHKSLEEVERYTREARKKTLADSGMAKFKSEHLGVPLDPKWDNSAKKY